MQLKDSDLPQANSLVALHDPSFLQSSMLADATPSLTIKTKRFNLNPREIPLQESFVEQDLSID